MNRPRIVAMIAFLGLAPATYAQVVINEFLYDDGGTDDREFVELFNAGGAPVDISGWTVGGRDPASTNSTATIPGATILGPGAYYVLGNTGVLNVNQTIAAGFLENDNESIELRDSTTALIDAVIYESNKGTTGWAPNPAPPGSQVGPGFFGNHQANDVAAAPSSGATSTVGRFRDGQDLNNNGRDFGMRASTPGTTNTPLGFIPSYAPPDVSASAVGSNLPNFAYSFVAPRVIDPTVVDSNNLNAIPAAPGTSKAIIAWDPSGGGNGVSTYESYSTGVGKSFMLNAYLDTRDTPIQTNSTNVPFRGSEFTFYGIGSSDALANATNLSGTTGFGPRALPAADTDAGFTGIFWVYEKVGESVAGLGDISEKLYLVDANDGGDAQVGGNTPLDWVILQTIDLSSIASGWFQLGISIDALGNGVATFNGSTYNFVTSTDLSGAFSVGYRENMQIGADGTPDALLRPATFAMVPEPATIALLLLGVPLLAKRRKTVA